MTGVRFLDVVDAAFPGETSRADVELRMQHESSNGSRDDCPESVTERVSEKSRGEEQLRSSWRERGAVQGCETSKNSRG